MNIAVHPDLFQRLDNRRKQILADVILWLQDYSEGQKPRQIVDGLRAKKSALSRYLGSSFVERQADCNGRSTIFIRSEDMSEDAEFIPDSQALKRLASESYIIPRPPNIAGVSTTNNADSTSNACSAFTRSSEEGVDAHSPTDESSTNEGKKPIRRDPFIQSIISIIADNEERKTIQRSYDSYLAEFPEISAAPDRACLASLLTTELAMFRLQKRVVQNGETLGKEYSQLQDSWNKAAETLRLTRDQRVDDGESDGFSFAQLVERYDDLQASAMIQLAEQMQEENRLREQIKNRAEREADASGGENILRNEFNIEIDRAAGRLVLKDQLEPISALNEAADVDEAVDVDIKKELDNGQ